MQEWGLLGQYSLRSWDCAADIKALKNLDPDKVVLFDFHADAAKKARVLGLIGSGHAGAHGPDLWTTNMVSWCAGSAACRVSRVLNSFSKGLAVHTQQECMTPSTSG
jgi:hypothetical protein